MQTYLRYCVGLDISKDTLQVCLSVIDTTGRVTVKATTKVANKPTGFSTLMSWVTRHRKLDLSLTYLMESTAQAALRGVPRSGSLVSSPARSTSKYPAAQQSQTLPPELSWGAGATTNRSYAGYDVVENQSGNHSGKTRISKKGNSRLHGPPLRSHSAYACFQCGSIQ